METYESGKDNDLVVHTSVLTGLLTNAGILSSTHSVVTSDDNETDGVSTTNATVNMQVGEELFHGYSAPLLHFASACCVIFILVGIPGNLITIIALFRCKKVRYSLISCDRMPSLVTIIQGVAKVQIWGLLGYFAARSCDFLTVVTRQPVETLLLFMW